MTDGVPPMIPACLPPRAVSRPKTPLPPGACDTHAHVFGARRTAFLTRPIAATPRPMRRSKNISACSTRSALRAACWCRGSAHGRDNSAMLDALARQPERLRGVAVADADIPPDRVARHDEPGVRGLRFNHFFRGGQLHYRGGVPLSDAQTLAPVMAELGWHLQFWIDVKDLPETIPMLKSLRLPVVIDHMGRTDARAGPAPRGSRACCAASARAGAGPSCPAPTASAERRITRTRGRFTKRWCRRIPERLVWGGDWPHPRVEGEMPDAGHLLELFQAWTPETATQQRILVPNPAKLYGFPNVEEIVESCQQT